MNHRLKLYPQPCLLKWLGGSDFLTSNVNIQVSEDAEKFVKHVQLEQRLTKALSNESDQVSPTNVQVNYNKDLHLQGYVLQWDKDGLHLEISTPVGLHYALLSIEQLLLREGNKWRFFKIEDEPDFPVRGVMLDIGRNKIPKLETLFAFIDHMSELKFNHLQFYIEGFPFEYKKYKDSFPNSTPITAEEFRELDAYAASRFIDLVPNQNCLGHMGAWLSKEEFRHLAEHPDGLPTPLPFKIPPVTLDPTNPESINLVKDLLDELLPLFSSDYANISMDEPFGLGTGESKVVAEKIGIGEVYLEYAQKVFDVVRNHNKKILMWGDVLVNHPDIIPMLPNDVTVLNWNYDDHISFEKSNKMLSENNVPYYVCPGTSSWSSISGRTDNMLNNIADAAYQGLKYGAKGLIVTDWGDNGHWQVQSMSYPGFIYAAGASWSIQKNLNQEEEIESYASECIFSDRSGVIGNLLLELGRYYHLENSTVENATYTNHLMNQGLMTREELEQRMNMMAKVAQLFGGTGDSFNLDYQYEEMIKWLQQRKEQLASLELQVSDGSIVKDELRNTIRLIEHGIGVHQFIYRIGIANREEEFNYLKKHKAQLELAINEFNRLWELRNRKGGLADSNKTLYKLLNQYKDRLEQFIED